MTNNWKWDNSNLLDSPALYVAIRAWATKFPTKKDIVTDWLYYPWKYYPQRKHLYTNLVKSLKSKFHDTRPEWMFYNANEGIFNFQHQSYAQSWACLRDINKLCKACGLNGFIIIFDEFEDVIYNLGNIKYQEAAFWNLFIFYSGISFSGLSFYAVTPDFSEKCKNLLLKKGYYNYDYERFEKLPKFEMSPLGAKDLKTLALKIAEIHSKAYDWILRNNYKSKLNSIVDKTSSVPIQNRVRNTIKEIINKLDSELEDETF